MEEHRPKPEDLLAQVAEEEARSKRGRLKVFFGAAPGVGKTYAMLEAARKEAAAGRDVVVGVVETHGRPETAALARGLEVLPRRRVEYRGIVLEEFDLDGALARRPALLLVDELAHTNAPGSRHAKRHQDVSELLEAGLDVFTTLNVQHLESRADVLQQIAGAAARETVPDSLLDAADEIELVDISPEDLLRRLAEGKVYLGERAEAAAANYFQESNLTALRELALRVTAERVDEQLRSLLAHRRIRGILRTGDRLMVAVAPSPFSTRLIRWTRRMAYAMDAPWLAVYVEGSRAPSEKDQRLLDANLALARELGAEIVLVRDDDVAGALVRVAGERHVTQIVIGKPREPRFLQAFRGGSLVDRVLRRSGQIDVYVVPAEASAGVPSAGSLAIRLDPPREFVTGLLAVAAATSLGLVVQRWTGYWTVGLIYLCTIVLLPLRVGRWAVMTAAALSALAWNFLFIPPLFTLRVDRVEDGLMLAVYLLVALVAGRTTARLREQERAGRERERRATRLYRLIRSIAEAGGLEEAVSNAAGQVRDLFGVDVGVLLAGREDDPPLRIHPASTFQPDEKNLAVARWVLQNRRKAGRFTDTLPGSQAFYVPLLAGGRSVGVLAVRPPATAYLPLGDRDILETFATQLALLIERERLRQADEEARVLAESDRLHRTLLDSVSHELKTPLAVLRSGVGQLVERREGAPDTAAAGVLGEMRAACDRLIRLVDNLLGLTRLGTGALKPRMDWCELADVVNAALETHREALRDRPIEVSLPPDLPLVRADFALMEQVVSNLVQNACEHTPPGTPIGIRAGTSSREPPTVFLEVWDRGPGLDPMLVPRLFDKFVRGGSARTGGLGLGLSIVRGFVEAQGGKAEAAIRPGGGASFTIHLPRLEHGEIPKE